MSSFDLKNLHSKSFKELSKITYEGIIKYKNTKNKLKHTSYLISISVPEEEIEKLAKFASFVEGVFENMHPENARLIKAVYIENKHKSELGYSNAAYYNRLRPALIEFISLYFYF